VPEPSDSEKQSFLQSILGRRSFIKEYELLGGALKVRFRTLTTREIDTVYQQVDYERGRGEIVSREDYWERINRYRLYLQTCRLESNTFLEDLPDGYSEAANPRAEAYWRFAEPPPGATGLPAIEEYFMTTIFPTEQLHRSVQATCGRFNRLVARLEALVDNSDFWKPTGSRS
jgi:hypothetical protein